MILTGYVKTFATFKKILRTIAREITPNSFYRKYDDIHKEEIS